MKINGLKKKALWENIKCCCIKGDVEHTYPLSECKHCKFTECWQSVPKKDFKVSDDIVDIKDLLIIIQNWGVCDCVEDLTGNGEVDFADVLIVIGAWSS